MLGSQSPACTFVFDVVWATWGEKQYRLSRRGVHSGTDLKSHLSAGRLEVIGAHGEQGKAELPAPGITYAAAVDNRVMGLLTQSTSSLQLLYRGG